MLPLKHPASYKPCYSHHVHHVSGTFFECQSLKLVPQSSPEQLNKLITHVPNPGPGSDIPSVMLLVTDTCQGIGVDTDVSCKGT